MTLKYNHVTGVYTERLTAAGQLIPLCIGSLSIIKVLLDWRIAKSTRKRMRRELWQACEECRRYGLRCSSSSSEPVPFQESRHNGEAFGKALLAAWLPWLMVFLYDSIDEDEIYSPGRSRTSRQSISRAERSALGRNRRSDR